MRALIIGGARHGEWVHTLDGVRMWVDIANAARHVIRKLTWGITDQEGNPIEVYVIHVAVHEQLQGPNEPNTVQQLLTMLTMNEFARAHGDKQEIPQETLIPAGSDIDTAAETLIREVTEGGK
jgi:hypothetical protein